MVILLYLLLFLLLVFESLNIFYFKLFLYLLVIIKKRLLYFINFIIGFNINLFLYLRLKQIILITMVIFNFEQKIEELIQILFLNLQYV